MFEVLTYSLADGWSNTWTTEDESGNEIPEYFDTAEEAEQAIKEEIEDTEYAIKQGYILPESRLTRDDFEIMETTRPKITAEGL
ncbi:MAG: hypothetical protein EVJ48_01695 [Candidatus Acidulodesulfobacterium acidiphilum]|uniref:Uncharacterized protein n=1 Tax=Candidatus Acidulodesulfobacterium acidiphilum TaxID=2597224 RepID=A0A520XGA5_9DELT|nr:MAG: hypothetical protein EVJ48_01695 [Candidatus Acidulodesulfobacterium acidiphilum]